MSSETFKPYQGSELGKKEQVAQMFDNISGKYDFLNHFFSLGIDKAWRKKTIKKIKSSGAQNILDVATGTGDLAMAASKAGIPKTIGVDISNGMLEVGREKVKKAGMSGSVELKYGDSENMPFETDQFDAGMVAFGVRNFENLNKGLTEMHRVIKPKGLICVLEFSKPSMFPVKQVFWIYFKILMPVIGKFISGDNRAYTYLPGSVDRFPYGKAFLDELEKVGFTDLAEKRLSGGIATLYTGLK